MSFGKLEEIKCPCGAVFEAELWNAINATEDPELKDALVCGEVNIVCCPSCGEIFHAEHFVLYHDPKSEMIAFVYPTSFSDQSAYWESKMREDFKKAVEDMQPDEKIDYEPMLLFGLDALANVVRDEEEEADEVSILEHCGRDLGLEIVKIKPSVARPLKIPRLLPRLRGKGSNLRQEILSGLEKLHKYNKNLTCYNRLHHLIEHNKEWRLDGKETIKK